MNKVACATLLITVSLAAQNAPAPQQTAPPASESAPQGQVHREYELKLTRRFTSDTRAFEFVSRVSPAGCAIPLVTVPVPDKKRFAGKTIPANPSVDPKIVLAPPLPACPQSVAPVKVTLPEPAAEKK